MKNHLLLALVVIVAMLTGCNKDEVIRNGNPAVKNFTVSVDNGAKTRAATDAPTRYVMEVYRGATASGTAELRKEQSTGTFTGVLLDDAQQYTILFWADYGTPTVEGGQPNANNEYDAIDLKAVRIAADKQPTKAAYAGLSRFTVGTDSEDAYTSVQLTHAVAQVNFVQKEALIATNNTLTVSFPESYKLNVDGNAVTPINGAVDYVFNNTTSIAANASLGISYIIAATGTPKTVFDITVKLNNEGAQVAPNVPFERNFKTRISGAYSNMYEATMTVDCNDVWETPDNDELFPRKAKLGDYYYSDNTFSTTLYKDKTCIGVVFWVDPTDASKGKIVSMDEPVANWNGLVTLAGRLNWGKEEVTGALNESDGKANMTTVETKYDNYDDFPAFKWCDTKAEGGLDWYLPAPMELRQLFAGICGLRWVKSNANTNNGEINDWSLTKTEMPGYTSYGDARIAFNERLESANGTKLIIDDSGNGIPADILSNYRSSMEVLNDQWNAIYVKLSNGSGSSGNKKSGTVNGGIPTSKIRVRAIAAF